MGLGYWLIERFAYDEDTGEVLTHNTWVYVIKSLYIHTYIHVSTHHSYCNRSISH